MSDRNQATSATYTVILANTESEAHVREDVEDVENVELVVDGWVRFLGDGGELKAAFPSSHVLGILVDKDSLSASQH